MAFGDLVKSNLDSAGSTTTLTADLGSNPASGNLLIAAAGAGAVGDSITSAPSGFTVIEGDETGTVGCIWYYKVSVGTEQTVSVTWSLTNVHALLYAEYEWDGTTPTVSSNEDVSFITDATNSMPSGAVTPDTSTNICIAVHVTDFANNSLDGQAIDGSWIEDILFVATFVGVKFSRLVNATGSQEATHSDSDTGDQMYGSMAAFSVAASGLKIPVAVHHHLHNNLS